MNIESPCQHIEELLSGYLDNELSQQESQRVTVHMHQCDSCNELFEQLQNLQGSIQKTQYPEMELEKLHRLLNDSTSRNLQNISWFAIIASLATLLVFGLYEFWNNSVMTWYERLTISMFLGGGLGLFATVLRQRLIARKTDKYRKVKL